MFHSSYAGRPGLSLLLFIILYVFGGVVRAGDILSQPTPIPDDELLSAVINAEYPQQARMDAVSRVAEQASEEDIAERVEWLAIVVRHDDAQAVMRGHALDNILAVGILPEGLIPWCIGTAGDADTDVDARVAIIPRLDRLGSVAGEAEREAIAALVARVAGTEEGYPAAAALYCLAQMALDAPGLRPLAAAVLQSVFGAGETNEERVLAAVQAAILLREREIVPDLRRLAGDASCGLRLRMAAVGGIGELGGASEEEYLSGLAVREPILRKVAVNALSRLRLRLSE
jgi:hypothetical protein